MSSDSVLMAMRDCTDVRFARLRHTLCIEIGGAMTADTPPQQIKEAAWPLGPCSNSFFTQRRVPSFGRQSLERHVDRHSICTETGALRSSTTHHLGTRPQAPNARRFALILQFTVVVSRFTLLRYRFTGYWLALCINERARPSLPSGRGGLSSSQYAFAMHGLG